MADSSLRIDEVSCSWFTNVDDVTIPPWVTTTTEASRSLEPVDLDVQLPRSIKPLHYVVKLQPFINGNFSIVGYMEVEMEVLEPTSNITLHISDIITKNDTVKIKQHPEA
nr:uncharacterized protein LOC113815307 [Penaeus vannamei]